jgi:hypothetical protein
MGTNHRRIPPQRPPPAKLQEEESRLVDAFTEHEAQTVFWKRKRAGSSTKAASKSDSKPQKSYFIWRAEQVERRRQPVKPAAV